MIANVFCWIVKRVASVRYRRRLCAAPLLALMVMGSASSHCGAAVLMVLGDSLSAGYGIEVTDGWVHLLAQRLAENDRGYRVVNASLSGETTAGGLDRLPTALAAHKPALVIVELGGNDGLRGLALTQTRENLGAVVRHSMAAGAQVLLIGIELPPNYGPVYNGKFRDIYVELAAEFNVPLVPFLLEGIALQPELMQDDGIHPRAEAQSRVLDNVWPYLEPLLK